VVLVAVFEKSDAIVNQNNPPRFLAPHTSGLSAKNLYHAEIRRRTLEYFQRNGLADLPYSRI
jgi:hypothetical protein